MTPEIAIDKLKDLTRGCHEKNEATASPLWAIVRSGYKFGDSGYHIWLAGPWFNRCDAEVHMNNHRYRYGDKAFVYCYSAHMSTHWRDMLDTIRETDEL